MACDALLDGWRVDAEHSPCGRTARAAFSWNEDWGAYLPDKPHENVTLRRGMRRPVGFRQRESISTVCRPAKDPATIKAFVDFQNDVTAKDIDLAVREGFKSIEHIKRYTTTGMATDQGKTSNLNGLQLASSCTFAANPADWPDDIPSALYTPQTFGAMAGPRQGRFVSADPQDQY